ncbi:hypothetical protein [Oryza sativa Japonica Group]|uniref:Uncharacterized protein n=1 Tax=Oryza sativa subsp. japonica TaxID=39947 RepID=Q8S0W0_ORYSJ|nr:hypothetical protein [Oryza sativa Japonica Group]
MQLRIGCQVPPELPSSTVAGNALPASTFSLHRRPPLQPRRSSSSIVALGRRCHRWVREEEKKIVLHFPEAEIHRSSIVAVNPKFAVVF